MKKIIVILNDGNIIGYWDKFDRKIRTTTISLFDEDCVDHEYERVILYIHINHKSEVLFPVIVPFNITIDGITDEMRQKSKILYDKITKEHWPIRS